MAKAGAFNAFSYRVRSQTGFHVIHPVSGQDQPLYAGLADIQAGYRSDGGHLPERFAGILIVLSGHGTLLTSGQPDRPAGAGLVLWHGRGECWCTYRGDGPGQVLSLMADGDRVLALLQSLIDRHGPSQVIDLGRATVRQALAMTAGPGLLALSSVDAQALVDSWLRLAWPVGPAGANDLRAALLACISEPSPVTAAARRLGVRREHLSRRLRRELGCPPVAWINRERMQQAALLLATGDQPVRAIAAQVGFASGTAFSAAFNRAHGQSPTSWRRARTRLPVRESVKS